MRHSICALFLFAFVLAAFASPALAALPSNPNYFANCGGSAQNWQVTTKVVNCVQSVLSNAVLTMMNLLVNALRPTIATVFLLATVFFGIRIALGVEQLTKETMVFAVKFAVVFFFAFNLPAFLTSYGVTGAPTLLPYAIVDTFTSMVSRAFTGAPYNRPANWLPWNEFDLYISKLLGFGATRIDQGLLGIVNTSITSGLTGVLCFLLGMLGIIALLYFGFRAVYSYLAAMVLIGYVTMIGVIMVPLALFEFTSERYFKKWLDLLIAAMLNPVILFAFLAIFLPAIESALYGVICMFSPGCPNPQWCFDNNCVPDLRAFQRSGSSMFSWQMPTDPVLWRQFEATLGQQRGAQAVQNFMNPSMSSAMDMGSMSFASTDFGPNQVQKMQDLTLAFLGLFVAAYAMLSLLSGIPRIADGIAQVFTGLEFEGMPFANEFRQVLSKMKSAVSGA